MFTQKGGREGEGEGGREKGGGEMERREGERGGRRTGEKGKGGRGGLFLKTTNIVQTLVNGRIDKYFKLNILSNMYILNYVHIMEKREKKMVNINICCFIF